MSGWRVSFLLRTAAFVLLASAAVAAAPVVLSQTKISAEQGGFEGVLLGGDFFGSSVASLGDLDENGTHEIAVGAPGSDDGDTDAGALWILSLDELGHVAHDQKISSSAGEFQGVLGFGDEFGASVAAIGDLNEDGVVDIAVGAPYTDNLFADSGAVWILFLGKDGTVKNQQKISATAGEFTGPLHTGDLFGYSVSGIGDLDRDGIPDIAVGAPLDDDGGIDKGAVWVLFLNRDGTVKAYQKISAAYGHFDGRLQAGDWFGNSVAGLGDLDGDGNVDLGSGTPRNDDGDGSNAGAVWILFLNVDGKVKNSQKISATSGGLNQKLSPGDLFGWSVAALGDVDRDGVTDLGVGAPFDDDGAGEDSGAIYLLLLGTSGTVKSSQKISDDAGGFSGDLTPTAGFGSSLAAIGDLDGNGVGDVAVGTPFDDDGAGVDVGALWVTFLTGGPPACGDASADGSVTSTDALVILRVSIGAGTCDLCVCDVDNSGSVAASDALRALRVAVEIPDELTCPYCPS